jgi:hypothetical protein
MSMYGPQQGQPQMGMPPKKKGLSTGCWIVLGVMLFFLVLTGSIIAYVSYKVATDKDVQNVMGAIGEAAQLATEAQQAPGTNELRAAGCEQALALDSARMQKLGDRFLDAGVSKQPAEVGFMVMCQMQSSATPPSCEDAVKAYVRGASPKDKFMLTVTAHGAQTCGGIYSPSGALISSTPPTKKP